MIFRRITMTLFAISILVCADPLLGCQIVVQKHTATANRNMLATVHPLATQSGVNAMAEGGNAVDAAIAAALTLGVVDGFNSGIGGGCFILIRNAEGEVFAIDGREMAPAKAHRDMFRDVGGPNDKPSQVGALASGVPGALAAYHQAVQRHGRLQFANLLDPAAEIAEQGFTVTQAYAKKLETAKADMAGFSGSTGIFFRQVDGDSESSPYQLGEIIKQPDLARTYRQIAKLGPSWFYNGPFAVESEKWMSENGGIMTARDFANYQTVDRIPIRTTYRGFELVGFPPPSSGGVHVAQILNILENFDLKQLHDQQPDAMFHVVAEAMKFAFADRAHWLGDPDFVDVPIGLIDKAYAKELAKKIDLNRVTPAAHGTPPGSESDFFQRHTTHVAAADSDGNWVALTTTVNTTFGAKYVVPGLGVVMNSQMDDFVANPGKPNVFGLVGGDNNAIDAKKRPLSSMSPTIVLKDGQPILTLGGAGGPKIITEVLWAIINHLDLGMPIGESIAQSRLHHQWSPKELLLESRFDDELAEALKKRGHELKRSKAMGICQGISYDPETGTFTGAHDPRTSGMAAGQQ